VVERKLFLLNCNRPEAELRAKFPGLWAYLQLGVKRGLARRYLCAHRVPWYSQEQRGVAPILFTYMGRHDAERGWCLRFILNHSRAIAANVYLMLYPKSALAKTLQRDPKLLRHVWQALNDIPAEEILGSGRVYGGGLHKVEPKELASAPAHSIAASLKGKLYVQPQRQLELLR
jgi:hypothetical protein